MELYNHNMFRADNREAVELRQKSTLEAMEDATRWLKGDGKVAVSSANELIWFECLPEKTK